LGKIQTIENHFFNIPLYTTFLIAIETLFFDVLRYSFLLPILAFLLRFERLKGKPIALCIVIYSIIIFTLLQFDDFLNQNQYRHIYSITYTTVEYLTFSFTIYSVLRNKLLKKIIAMLSTAFLIFEGIYFFAVNFHTIDSVPIGIETIFIILFVFCLFYEQFQMTTPESIYDKFWFWFVIGILFYLASTFFLNILASTEKDTARKYWYMTYIFETIKNIFFAIGMIVYAKKQSSEKKISLYPNLDFK
jgi:hypothetical protein